MAQVPATPINVEANDLTTAGTAAAQHLQTAATPPAGALPTAAGASPVDVAAAGAAGAIHTKMTSLSTQLVAKGPQLQGASTAAGAALQAQDAENGAQVAGVGRAGTVRMAGFGRAPLPLDPTPSPSPEPPQCKLDDQAKLIQKFVELNQKNDQLTRDITDYDRKYPPGHAFNMNDPAQAAEYYRGQELSRERGKLIRDYGELLRDATTCGATQDPKTGDILWPDGTRTTLGPPR